MVHLSGYDHCEDRLRRQSLRLPAVARWTMERSRPKPGPLYAVLGPADQLPMQVSAVSGVQTSRPV
jgi:hypothetical protein